MGTEESKEMLFWTQEEYSRFAEEMMDKPLSYYAFEMLYWCGVREGELLALTPGDFDFEKQTVTISKSYQRIKGKDVITDPKTPKSNRVIQMPAFLCEEMRDYIKSLYGVKPTDRIFTVTKEEIQSGIIHATKCGSRSEPRNALTRPQFPGWLPATTSNLRLFRDLEGIVDLNAQVPHCRLQLRVAEQ